MGRARLFALLSTLGLSTWAAPGQAMPVVDQDSGPATAEVWCDNDCDLQQSFTVGVTGQLTGLDVWVITAPDTGMSLSIAGQVMSALGPLSGFSGLLSLDLSPLGLSVLDGDTITFDFEHDDILVLMASEGTYVRGDLTFFCYADGCINPRGPSLPDIDYPLPAVLDLEPLDVAFRTHVIPEPGSVLLLGVGVLLLSGTSRRFPRTPAAH